MQSLLLSCNFHCLKVVLMSLEAPESYVRRKLSKEKVSPQNSGLMHLRISSSIAPCSCLKIVSIVTSDVSATVAS